MPTLVTEKRWDDQPDLVLSAPVLWEFNRKHFIIEVRGLETTELTCIYVTTGTLWGCCTIWKNHCSVSDLCACLKKTFEMIDADHDEPVAAPDGWEVLDKEDCPPTVVPKPQNIDGVWYTCEASDCDNRHDNEFSLTCPGCDDRRESGDLPEFDED